jgi:hypothetical protein
MGNYTEELRKYISTMSTKRIYEMIDQYTWEMECGLRNHSEKLKLLYEELERR